MLGAYVAWSIAEAMTARLGDSAWAFAAAVAGAVLVAAIVGALIEALVLKRLYDAPELLQLTATFAIMLIVRDAAELDASIETVMTRNPRTIPATALVRDAVRMFRECRQDEIPVVDGEGRPVGILDVQDLVAMRLVRD